MLKAIIGELSQIFFGYGVPFVTTPDTKLQILLDHLDMQDGSTFIDIGSGDGKVLEAVSKKFNNSNCIGYESSPYPYKQALGRQQKSLGHFEVYKQDIFTANLNSATHIYIYMVPYMLKKLTSKIQSECNPGTKIYVKTHSLNGCNLQKKVPLSKKEYLYIYVTT